MIQIINLGVKIPSFISKKSLKEYLKSLASSEDKQLNDLSVVFTDDDYLLEVNKQYLHHDYYTDVITFDYSDGSLVSGDIMISLPRVKENAESLKVSFVVMKNVSLMAVLRFSFKV
jgi:ssRNA-specific RNase YbeY (16S rRNA maturation enzyme)